MTFQTSAAFSLELRGERIEPNRCPVRRLAQTSSGRRSQPRSFTRINLNNWSNHLGSRHSLSPIGQDSNKGSLNMGLDATHPTLLTLTELLPQAMVCGGSFAHWLPHPKRVPLDQRESTFKSAFDDAVAECLREVVSHIGLEPGTQIPRARDGRRLWPVGYVGSLTHKGTVVLGAVALKAVLGSLGIDLERLGESPMKGLGKNVSPEGLPMQIHPHAGTLLAFSAKEAVFKALYPTHPTRLGHQDIRLRWTPPIENRHEAVADSPGFQSFRVQCRVMQDWIVSAATPL